MLHAGIIPSGLRLVKIALHLLHSNRLKLSPCSAPSPVTAAHNAAASSVWNMMRNRMHYGNPANADTP